MHNKRYIKDNTIKPCARDGYMSCLIKNKLIIFGGDRHKMSFNDFYIMTI